MATLYSNQQVKINSPGNSLVDGTKEKAAYSKVDLFERSTSATTDNPGAVAQNDVLVLTRLPKGARILGGQLSFTALGAGVTGTLALGAQNLITAATSLAAAGSAAIGSTIALGFGYTLPADTDLTLTIGGGNPAASQTISGYVEYTFN